MATPVPRPIDASAFLNRLRHDSAMTVIDVRTRAEFETMHIPGSHNIPLGMLEAHAEELAARLDRHVVLVCRSGARATQACRALARAGARNVCVLTGGVPAYVATGGDVVHGQARWALERQVRLVAAGAVSLSTLAALRWPAARIIAAGVGVGLTISVLTDVCPLSRVLSALPYNRGPRDRTPAEIFEQLPTT